MCHNNRPCHVLMPYENMNGSVRLQMCNITRDFNISRLPYYHGPTKVLSWVLGFFISISPKKWKSNKSRTFYKKQLKGKSIVYLGMFVFVSFFLKNKLTHSIICNWQLPPIVLGGLTTLFSNRPHTKRHQVLEDPLRTRNILPHISIGSYLQYINAQLSSSTDKWNVGTIDIRSFGLVLFVFTDGQ